MLEQRRLTTLKELMTMTTTNEEILKALDELKAATTAAKNILKGGPGSGPHKGGGSAPGKNADSQSKADYHNARADHHAAVANELQSKIDSEYKTQGMAAARLDPKVGQLVEARDANQLASSTNRDVAFTYGEHASTGDPKTRAEADLNASKYANKYTRAADIINTQAGGN